MKRSYYEDVQMLKNTAAGVWFVILIAVLALLPFLIPAYYVYVASLVGVNIMVALGLNLLVGNTGQISLGHAGFVAIGAYTAVLLQGTGVPFPFAMIAAGVSAGIFGILLGIPALKLEGPYLAIATLAFGIAVEVVIGRIGLFGGHMGLQVPGADFYFFRLIDETSVYYLIAFTVLIGAIAIRNILKSKIGRAFQAVRDSNIAASAMGVDIARYKTMSFAVSAFYAGVAGALWAVLIGFINPNLFNFVLSIQYLAMVVIGGLGTILGSVLGATALTLLILQADAIHHWPVIGPFLQFMADTFMTRSGLPNTTWIITGLFLMLIVIFEPLGLYGLWLRAKIYWKTWPF